MAIRDLLWACPLCGAEEGIRPAGRTEACRACGTRFRRRRGADIEAAPPGHKPLVLHAADWLLRLPPARLPGEGQDRDEEEVEVEYRKALVVARFASIYTPVRHGRRFLGRVERFGPAVTGSLVLTSRALIFSPEGGGAQQRWPLETISAVQPSSAVLQIKPRNQPVASFRFREASVRLWEDLIQAALRRYYRRTGRGEIVEFQPRITVR